MRVPNNIRYIMIRCAYVTHHLAKTSEGGAEVQIQWTEEQITRLRPEYNISRFNPWTDSIDEFDLIHIFAPTNFAAESARIATYAKTRGKIVLTSPIFHPYPGDGGWSSLYACLTNKLLTNLRRAFLSGPLSRLNPHIWLYHTLTNSDMILPNSKQEADILSQYFDIEHERIRVIPNGIDSRFAQANPKLFTDQYGLKNFILFVGRIEPVKNTTMLIEAFKHSGLDTDLVIIGRPVDPTYYERCRILSSERVHIFPLMHPQDEMFLSAYAAAKVVALPSLYETVGLVALEGGLAGANVVVTEVGGAREYLRDDAWYVDPQNISSISHGLRSAYNSPKTSFLRERLANDYSWEETGKLTAQAYDYVLNSTDRKIMLAQSAEDVDKIAQSRA